MLQYHDSTWLHCISHTFVFDRVSLILFILSQACGPSWQRVRWTSKAGDSIFDRHSCRSLGDRCCVEVCRRVWLLLCRTQRHWQSPEDSWSLFFFLLRTCLDKNYTQFITIPWFFSPRLAENHESKCRSEAVHRGWACSGSFGKRFGRPKRSKNRQMPQVQNSKYWHYIYYMCVCVMMIRCDSIHAHTHNYIHKLSINITILPIRWCIQDCIYGSVLIYQLSPHPTFCTQPCATQRPSRARWGSPGLPFVWQALCRWFWTCYHMCHLTVSWCFLLQVM